MDSLLPPIPAKRYFTIGEVGELCGVKPHVLRYWEQEFTQLRPVKRRGNRRYYQRHEVMMIRRIRGLLYDQGFTISGARNKLQELVQTERQLSRLSQNEVDTAEEDFLLDMEEGINTDMDAGPTSLMSALPLPQMTPVQIHEELLQIRALLTI
ncbi:MerR family transcriptional regulator [Limnohabitans sp. WS1]|uniref:MerR family transcriptional regulator n=1 Tax=Limnohabitans sp. WS1 TaxID=1100726 RepID=UPI000D36C8FF|nr:MerR family transcriptional regulator [Limnohabitans sp. WS1]PUE13846.1 MerR family transcriptional regulator [Limnohabitans sp. WS1]